MLLFGVGDTAVNFTTAIEDSERDALVFGMGFAEFGGSTDHAGHARRREPPCIRCGWFRGEFGSPLLCVARGLPDGFREILVVTGHRRKVLVDCPLDPLDPFDGAERRAFVRDGALVD